MSLLVAIWDDARLREMHNQVTDYSWRQVALSHWVFVIRRSGAGQPELDGRALDGFAVMFSSLFEELGRQILLRCTQEIVLFFSKEVCTVKCLFEEVIRFFVQGGAFSMLVSGSESDPGFPSKVSCAEVMHIKFLHNLEFSVPAAVSLTGAQPSASLGLWQYL